MDQSSIDLYMKIELLQPEHKKKRPGLVKNNEFTYRFLSWDGSYEDLDNLRKDIFSIHQDSYTSQRCVIIQKAL